MIEDEIDWTYDALVVVWRRAIARRRHYEEIWAFGSRRLLVGEQGPENSESMRHAGFEVNERGYAWDGMAAFMNAGVNGTHHAIWTEPYSSTSNAIALACINRTSTWPGWRTAHVEEARNGFLISLFGGYHVHPADVTRQA